MNLSMSSWASDSMVLGQKVVGESGVIGRAAPIVSNDGRGAVQAIK